MRPSFISGVSRVSVFLFAPVIIAGLTTGCRFSSVGFAGTVFNSAATQNQTGEFPASVKKLVVENQLGAVKITVADAEPFGWTWKLGARARSTDEAQADLKLAALRVETNGDTLTARLDLPDSRQDCQYSSDLEFRVPKSVAVQARNHFAPVEIAGVDGPVDARSESGSVEVCDVREKVTAETSFSSLRIADTGAATLRNQSGEIVAERVHGPLDAETTFSRLSATDISGPLKARDQSGCIDATKIEGNADLKTSFASLSARDIRGPLTARNQSGSIDVERVEGAVELETSFAGMEVNDIKGDARLKNQSSGIRVRNVSGAVIANTSFGSMDVDGSGDSFVCHNQSGSITVHATSPHLARLEAGTSFSSLEVRLPSSVKPAIQAHTTFGDVASDFPLAQMDAGAAQIALENQSGRIVIQKTAE